MYLPKRGKKKVDKESPANGVGGHHGNGSGNHLANGGHHDGSGKPADDKKKTILISNDDLVDKRIADYQLMEAIGKGGYGIVYRGLNINNGMTVAVKRIALTGIPSEELESIESEIRLLQNLDHPNIVKYIDAIRTDDYLNIILEFVENGALSSLLSKIPGNRMNETLVANYIAQVVRGLHYLHTQGVIHRDIKGANILSDKSGICKLADFGVATKLNESRKSDSVVGTPYWMAPEIIEMTGQQSSACDIWSVGCTAYELFTGKPPYFDLQQMPALFRIVQDEHPPLPDGISSGLEDFLMQCFTPDHQILVQGKGWTFIETLKKEDHVATYDQNMKTIQYQKPIPLKNSINGEILIINQVTENVVNIKYKEDENENENEIDVITTTGHEWFIQRGKKKEEEDEIEWEEERIEGQRKREKEYHKVEAETLYSKDTADYFRVLNRAVNGIQWSNTDPLSRPLSSSSSSSSSPSSSSSSSLLPLPFLSSLHLSSSPSSIQAFLHLYGYWMISGSLSSTSSLLFHLLHSDHQSFLRQQMEILELEENQDWQWEERNHSLRVMKMEWVEYFQCEYGEDENRGWMDWVLERLEMEQLRALLNGLEIASSGYSSVRAKTTKPNEKSIFTSSSFFRDQILTACLHAGYYASFQPSSSSSFSSISSSSPLHSTSSTSPPSPSSPSSSSFSSFSSSISSTSISPSSSSPSSSLSSSLSLSSFSSSSSTSGWLISFSDSTSNSILSSSSHVHFLPYSGPVYCITVPTGLFFVRRVIKQSGTGEILSASQPIIIGNCFQKDPNRRIDAPGLLKHPWLKKALEATERPNISLQPPLGGSKLAATVKLAASAFTSTLKPSKVTSSLSVSSAVSSAASAVGGDSGSSSSSSSSGSSSSSLQPKVQYHATLQPAKVSSLSQKSDKKHPALSLAEGDNLDDLDWGEDEDGDAKVSIPIQSSKPKLSTSAQIAKLNAPSSSAAAAAQPVATPSGRTPAPFLQRVVSPRGVSGANKNYAGSSSSSAVSFGSSSSSSGSSSSSSGFSGHKKGVSLKLDEEDPFSQFDDDDTSSQRSGKSTGLNRADSNNITNMMSVGVGKKLKDSVEKEDEEEDYGEMDDEIDDGIALKLNKKSGGTSGGGGGSTSGSSGSGGGGDGKMNGGGMNNNSNASDEIDLAEFDTAEADPFDDITFDESTSHDEDIALSRSFLRLIAQLTPKNDDRSILDACDKLIDLSMKSPEPVSNLMTVHGVIPIMEMLESPNEVLIVGVLKVVNQIVGKNPKFQQSLSLAGLIPAIIRFGGRSYVFNNTDRINSPEIRMEAANFVRQFCYASDFTRKMFIACDGLPVLVSFLQEEYQHSKTLVWNAIDCIRHVFDIKTNPKNDFCRLFCKFGLLEPLSRTLQFVNADKDSSNDAAEYVRKIAKILHLFSQGDKVVKTHFAKPTVIESLIRVLSSLEQDVLILILKSICNISMDPTTLDLLEAAGAIPALIPYLSSPHPENQHQVLLTMYYLTQIKASRQEQAASCGIIPHLQRFIRSESTLKQFAYPIIFLLAKTSNKSRSELKKYGGVQFYIDVLRDVYWRTHALEVLAAWLQEETQRVGFILNSSTNINKLLSVFKNTHNSVQFEKMLPLFRKMLSTSIRVNQSFGRSAEFIGEIKHRLERHGSHSNKNNIRINLLKILALIFVAHQNGHKLFKDSGLLPILQKLCEDKASVIVVSLAQKLVDKFRNTSG